MEFPNPKQQPTNKGSTRRYACTEGDGRVGDECALALRAPCLYSACLSTVSLPCMLPEALRLLSDDEKPVRTLQYYPRLLVDAPPVMLFPLSSDVRLVRPAPALAFLTRSRCLQRQYKLQLVGRARVHWCGAWELTMRWNWRVRIDDEVKLAMSKYIWWNGNFHQAIAS
jgi:hypothetical protein